ncbi:RagB/SusD family nutrient uptake outer membrane protein [Chitinophaga filiformis]|uniref:RagB/SusD family nutrient uptake outer membrane protein n=1 Tax=Chitinophaga filiformis TaxID=104663 RepID=UPI001F42433A|nr:RagB/SusD family nutrient uptake outer membrane protein [Chitinophaga filiformis]MCF6405145.1 RagB/SusD family nutrient uptake outer membrane protein [Chitinophaga filiformis]
MKNKIYISIITLLAILLQPSCKDLNIDPLNVIQDKDVFATEAGVKGYLATIYRALPIEDFYYRQEGSGFNRQWEHFYHPGALCGEMVGPYGSTYDGAGGFGYWPYGDIRTVNYFIENLPVYATGFSPDQIEAWLGEAYFCRAYFYFALAKRYGGIPIIRKVQHYPEQSLEELQVHRDKEVDVWNFIGDDLDSAYNKMPATSERGRANRYVAAALKSRAMLYAGSIAKYGSENFVAGDAREQGFAGIPASAAAGFFQKAWDAAKLLEGRYSLYRKKTDKELNYVDLFLDRESTENILVRDYSLTTGTAHSWDATMTCRFMTADGLSRAYPTLELVERFTGQLPIVNPDGTPRRFDNTGQLSQGLEPRLLATIYFPGATLRGRQFDMQRGIYEHFAGTAADELGQNPPNRQYRHLAGKTETLFNGMRIIGFTGISTDNDDLTRSGLYVRKYVDYNRAQSQCGLYMSTQSWIDMRYAEVLLNRAEAAVELNNMADARNVINDIRDRAGAPLLTGEFTIDTVRNERCKELAFEKQYWWDIRRWRIADRLLDNTKYHALMPYYVADEQRYIFLREFEPFQRSYNFEKKFYYEPIPGGELGKNPNLYPNNPNH